MDLNSGYADRLEQERCLGNLSFGQARVLLELWRLVIVGDHEPSEERLRDLAGVSRSTVGRAKRRAKALGLLTWERQRDPGTTIQQERPCTYQLALPTMPPVCRVRQPAERQISRSKEQQLMGLQLPDEATRRMLAERSARLFGPGSRQGRPVRRV